MTTAQTLLDLALRMIHGRYELDPSEAAPMAFMCKGADIHGMIILDFADQHSKDLSIAGLSQFLREHGCDGSIFVSEAWLSQKSAASMNSDAYVSPTMSQDRVEVLICEVSTADQYLSVIQKMNRDDAGKFLGFEEMQRYDSQNIKKGSLTVSSRFDFFGGNNQKLDS